ncbi:MAG: sn-glycerol-1-phosphate dehydrogenase [Pseudomonadota bacterium]
MDAIVAPAVARSASVSEILVDRGAIDQAAAVFKRNFADETALLMADENTWQAAGEALDGILTSAGIATSHHILPANPRPKPDRVLAEEMRAVQADHGGTAVSVGSGVINDLVKYGAYQLEKPYFCVATAASMDGYSSSGSPLVDKGFKKTIECVPPKAILADLDIIAAAPEAMAGWGYGDLAGKMPAAGDWIIADALGIEAIDSVAWPLVQDNLRDWLSDPNGIAQGNPEATAALFAGLTIAGLAMEFVGNSRPASGADHQVAHIWEMEKLVHEGERVSHGACVSIGCMTILRLYDWLLEQDLTDLDVDAIVAGRADLASEDRQIEAAFPDAQIAARAKQELRGKFVEADQHQARLEQIMGVWPDLKPRLRGHLMRADEMRALLSAAGAPVDSAQIGVSATRHKATTLAARFIRSRYTMLDLLSDTGLLTKAVDAVFAPSQVKVSV